MADTSGSQGRYCFKKETTYNVDSIDNNSVSGFFSSEDLKRAQEYAEDSSLIGTRALSDKFPTYQKNAGSVSIVGYPENLGWELFFTLGKVGSVVSMPDGFVGIFYKGSSESCLISKVGDDLIAKIGDLGSETLDANFGTGGTIDLSTTSFDDIKKLSEAINIYTDYNSFYIGIETADTTLIPDFADTQTKSQTLKLNVIPSSTVGYLHSFKPVGLGESLPSFTTCVDRVIRAEKYTGGIIDNMELSLTPGEILQGSKNIVAKSHIYESVVYPTLADEQTDPFIANDYRIFINGVESLDIAEMKLAIKNNLDADKKNLGSREYRRAEKGKINVELDGTYYLNPDTINLIDKYYIGAEVEVLIVGVCLEELETDKHYTFFARIPKMKITDTGANVSGPDTIVPSIKLEGFAPDSAIYEVIEIEYTSKVSDYTA